MYPKAKPTKRRKIIIEQTPEPLIGKCSSIFTQLQTRRFFGKKINHPTYTTTERRGGIPAVYSQTAIALSLQYDQCGNIDYHRTRNTLDEKQIQEFIQFYGKDHEQYITRIVKGNLPTPDDEVAFNAFCDKMVELTISSWSSNLQKLPLPITLLSCLAKINSALSQQCLNTIFKKIVPHCNDDSNTQRDSALHLAVLCQQPQIVILKLLTQNATKEIIDKSNHRNETPLSIAGFNGDIEAADCLLKQGAQLKTLPFTVMPIIAAARAGQMAMIDFLLICQYYDVNVIQRCQNTRFAVTPLIESIKFGYFNNAKKLIEIHKADVNLCHPWIGLRGYVAVMAPLWYLVQASAKNYENIYEINHFTEWLCNKGANVNFIDANDESLLWLAIKNGRIDMVNIFLDAGADPHFYNEDTQQTLLQFALSCENYDAIESLIKKIVSADPTDENAGIVADALTYFKGSIKASLEKLPTSNVQVRNDLCKTLQEKLRSDNENNLAKLLDQFFSTPNDNIGDLNPIVNSIRLYCRAQKCFKKIKKSHTNTTISQEWFL
jgi:ankyrin repeat protein